MTLTLTLPSFESTEHLIRRKLAVKTTTFRNTQLDSIGSLKTLMLAESVSLSEGESLKLREYISEFPADSAEYKRGMEVLQRAALPFMLQVLLKRVTSFESPSAALSAYWDELEHAVLRWEPEKYHVTFKWFVTETLSAATRRLISDEKGNRGMMEKVMELVALLKTFRREEVNEAIESETYDGELFSVNLEAEVIFEKIVETFGPIYLDEVNPITGKQKRNPTFWKQRFFSLETVQETLEMMKNLRPLSLDYSMNSEMGTLRDTIPAGETEYDEDELAELEYQATKLARWEEVLAEMKKTGVRITTLEKYASEIGAYLRNIASMDQEDLTSRLEERAKINVPAEILDLAEQHMLPFYNEYR